MSRADETDLLARMDWLIGAAPSFDSTNATDPSVRGPGYNMPETNLGAAEPRPEVEVQFTDCDGCLCPVLNMPPCSHCEEHYVDDGETFLCDADAGRLQ